MSVPLTWTPSPPEVSQAYSVALLSPAGSWATKSNWVLKRLKFSASVEADASMTDIMISSGK